MRPRPARERACSISATRPMPYRNLSPTSKTLAGRSWLEHALDLQNRPYGASLASAATAGTVLPIACRPLSASSPIARLAASMTRERSVTTANRKHSTDFVNVSDPAGHLDWWAEDIHRAFRHPRPPPPAEITMRRGLPGTFASGTDIAHFSGSSGSVRQFAGLVELVGTGRVS